MHELTAKEILARLDLRKLYPESGNSVYLLCPAHNDSGRGNLYVNPNYCYCFACGHNEAAIEHIMRVRGIGKQEAWTLAKQLLHETPINGQAAAPLTLNDKDAKRYAARLWQLPEKLAWLQSKYGLLPQTIQGAGLGHTGRAYTIPVYNLDGTLRNVRYRADKEAAPDSPNKYWGTPGHNAPSWYVPPVMLHSAGPVDTLHELIEGVTGHNRVVLTEGELDAVALAQLGIPAISATDGARALLGNGHAIRLEALAGLYVGIAYDADAAGRGAASELVYRLGALGIEARLLVWPHYYGKDASELVARGFNPKEVWRPLHYRTFGLPELQKLQK